jgi:hypothetical protein
MIIYICFTNIYIRKATHNIYIFLNTEAIQDKLKLSSRQQSTHHMTT